MPVSSPAPCTQRLVWEYKAPSPLAVPPREDCCFWASQWDTLVREGTYCPLLLYRAFTCSCHATLWQFAQTGSHHSQLPSSPRYT